MIYIIVIPAKAGIFFFKILLLQSKVNYTMLFLQKSYNLG